LLIEDKILAGSEEISRPVGHVPQKEGVRAGLLCCEMVASRGASLGERLQAVFGKVGSFSPLRENFRLTPEVKQKFTEKLRSDPGDLSGSELAKAARIGRLKLSPRDGA
jgi:hypothetical protein